MWRVRQQEDQGVASIVVVLLMPILLLFGALVFDGGRIYLARQRTQNAADAGALAKATDCALNRTGTDLGPYEVASGAVSVYVPVCRADSTTVSMTRHVEYLFRPGGGNVTKDATASWNILTSTTGVFPITIATCAFDGLTFQQMVTFHARNFGGCNNPSGQFGWTDINCTSPSKVTVGLGFGIGGTTGNTPRSCTNAQLDAFIGKDVLVPVWDPTITTCGYTYCLTTFALFHFTGWSGNGNNFGSWPSSLKKQCDARDDGDTNFQSRPPENTPCIRGYFKRFTTQGGGSGAGACNTSTVLFACRIYLSN